VPAGWQEQVSPDGKLVAYSIAREPPTISDGDQVGVSSLAAKSTNSPTGLL
jgi:hypothetical protein